MSQVVTVPAWVVPPPRQLRDAFYLAAARADQLVRERGVAAAMDWVLAGGPAPVSHRPDPVTPAVVREELLLADLLAAGGAPPRGLPVPVVWDAVWSAGVAPALAWMLGDQRHPPVVLPRRHPDGTLFDADDLYREAVAGRHYLEPEDRARARAEARLDAALYARLAAEADSAII